jgi:MoxR-like ATPase
MSLVLPWESNSYYHRIKQAFWLEPSSEYLLLDELQQPEKETVNKVVAYLADHRSTKLEQALKGKVTNKNLPEIVEFSLMSGRLRMLDVLERIVSLEQLKTLSKVSDPVALAHADAQITPLPQRSFEVITKSLLRGWSVRSGILNKIGQYFISTVTWSYGVDLDTPPRSRWVAQSQWMFFRGMAEDAKWIGSFFVGFFTTTWKAAVAASTVLVTLVGLKYLYDKYHVGTPENLDKKFFRNLNAEARQGRLRRTIGRREQLDIVKNCLTTPPGQKPCIPILVGEPGVGKTQLIEGLALSIQNGEIPHLKGKKVFVVNTASLSEWGNFSEQGAYSSRLDTLFEQITGFEDQIILFFDEAHNAGVAAQRGPGSTETAGTLLETLKTKLIERNILAVLATTTEEYETHIATNKAFTDRIRRVDFPSLSQEETKILLQEKVGFGSNNPVEVTDDAIEAVLTTAEQHLLHQKRSNPRKSSDILQEAINYVYAWTPKKFDDEIEKKELEQRALLNQCRIDRRKTPGWSRLEAGQQALRQLQQIEAELTTLYQQRTTQRAVFETITRLRSLEPIYTRREYEMVHYLKRSTSEAAQKTYLFMQFVLLPQLRSMFEEEAIKLGEKMPLRVDAAVVNQLFKT